MTPTKAMTRYCDARTRSGGTCRRPAGWGTPHPRRGRCKLHGGSTRSQCEHVAQEEALDFARNALGAEVDDDPLEAMLQAVRLASGTVAYWRTRLSGVEHPPEMVTQSFERATLNLSRVAKAAVDAGVDEKLVQIEGRMAERIALAFEEALAAEKVEIGMRTRLVTRFAEALARLEGEPIEGEARQLAA